MRAVQNQNTIKLHVFWPRFKNISDSLNQLEQSSTLWHWKVAIYHITKALCSPKTVVSKPSVPFSALWIYQGTWILCSKKAPFISMHLAHWGYMNFKIVQKNISYYYWHSEKIIQFYCWFLCDDCVWKCFFRHNLFHVTSNSYCAHYNTFASKISQQSLNSLLNLFNLGSIFDFRLQQQQVWYSWKVIHSVVYR